MDLIQFIRILLRNAAILIIVPVFMAVLVYLLTMNTSKTYTSKTLIYTGIASGYSLESGSNTRVDFFASSNALDNLQNIIKAKKTLEAVSIKMFAQNMMLNMDAPSTISEESYKELKQIVPEEVRQLVDTTSLDNTIRRFIEYKNQDEDNFIYKLLNLFHPHYSLEAISKINVKRIGNSDLIEISYSNDDPAICYQTLDLLNAEFIANYRGLKENQTDAVVKYFERQLNYTTGRLNLAEDELANFNKENRIINYYEQTKHIASLEEKFQLQYQAELLSLNGAMASIKDLEGKMSENQKVKLHAGEIIDLRNQLSEISGEIALNQAFEADSTSVETIVDSDLFVQSSDLKMQLSNAITDMHELENTSEGIARIDLVKEWLTKVILYEETRSRLDVLDIKRKEFDELYARYAPLGTTVKRLEREINVVEQEYLSNLHSLSLAKLKQQNIQLATGLKVIDQPDFPINPLPSKRKFLVVLAFLAGFVSVVVIIILLEYFDTSIKNAERAKLQIRLNVEGVYPKILDTKEYDVEKVSNAALSFLAKRLYLKCSPERNTRILFVSMNDGEGKSLLMNKIAQKLKGDGNEVEIFTPHPGQPELPVSGVKVRNFTLNSSLIQSSSFFHSEEPGYSGFSMAELPSINHNPVPAGILRDADLIFLVCRANRVWKEADEKNLEIVRSIGQEPLLLLNGVHTEFMESFVGEIPKKRSLIRRLVKNWLKGQFKGSKSTI